ncbi:predicted protein [Scheffersomyces stipitis CBS 6054]|uniref:Uncharacterized protein n=1 Tax=Scheffersomyces stipitis (strain ATCC 58785 / CBS 6054 / NBRC 10063 / NRRL Y-11545) TaxID=322104 RepID=A3LVF2_PICST|nr:predicted protein [Scheffersomyces stipitis CBS 6054]ABN67110.2 predicted protein [Scheffersomyces stipitis CBS 6054]KAG2734679.1 hypothetical protein G9P44_002685 [Scheffersomyces stipitis]
MTEPAILPYGGLMTKTLEDEKEREAKLESQSVEVKVNGEMETIRPEALRVRGVDSLSTDDIKAFVDYYLNYTAEEHESEDGDKKTEFVPHPVNEQLTFKIEWINDTAINIAFATHEDAFIALSKLSIIGSNPSIADNSEALQPQLDNPLYLSDIVQERETKPYNPTIPFKNSRDLSKRLDIGSSVIPDENSESIMVENNEMDEDESSVVLYIRQSFKSDRKVKNAKIYSRYYLLHGEPERRPYTKHRNNQRQGGHSRGGRRSRSRNDSQPEEEEEDLFADRLKSRNAVNDDDEDLFSDRLRNRDRSRSPDRMDDGEYNYRDR